jgi:hypothetical protein
LLCDKIKIVFVPIIMSQLLSQSNTPPLIQISKEVDDEAFSLDIIGDKSVPGIVVRCVELT